ncbi:MAG: mechanosensitive ion channel family protein [Verrucomicrobiales bacterium]|nr:mechanosensitive ion channel family protein [Verrucomicrobiales bacterium]
MTGAYPLYDGSVTGRVEGRELAGEWREASGRHGAFLFSLSRDGGSFMGRFDSGEWWTGIRLSDSQEYLVRPADLSSPRETLRSFLEAANSARGGFIERIRPALDTIDFADSRVRSAKVPDSPLLPGERIAYARELFGVLDELTFRIWSVPGPTEPGAAGVSATEVTLNQAGTTNTFTLRFERHDDSWLIEPPLPTELADAQVRLRERRGGRPPTAREHLLLRNPRDTLRTFIEEMGRFDLGGRTNVLRTLDLQNLGFSVQEQDVTLLAEYLKQVIDRIGFVLYQEIPNDPGDPEPYVHFRHGAGNVVIAPFAAGDGANEWRFTADTLHNLRYLYAAIEDMPEVAGTLESPYPSVYFAIRDALRGQAPWLLRLVGPVEGWQWVLLLVSMLASFWLSKGVAALILWALARRRAWAGSFAGRRGRLLLVWPLRSTILGLCWVFWLGVLGLPEIMAGPLRSLSATLSIVSGVWLAYRGIGLAADYSHRAIGTTGHQAVLSSLAFGILRILLIVVAALLLAEAWSLPYSSVLAGLGIGGLAFALAAQPTLQNMIAGFTLFADSPLSVGDLCRYGDKMGTVEQIGLRSTRVRSLDRSVVSIPNSEFANLQLVNLSKRDRILLRTTLQLRYETTPDQLRFVLAEVRRLLIRHPRIHPEPARVRFVEFGAHSLDLEVYAYVRTSEWSEFLAVREDLFLRLMDLVRESGTGFAFPSQVNYFARDTGIDPDLTRQAEAKVAVWRQTEQLPFPDFDPAEMREMDGQLDYPPTGSPQAGAGPGPRG